MNPTFQSSLERLDSTLAPDLGSANKFLRLLSHNASEGGEFTFAVIDDRKALGSSAGQRENQVYVPADCSDHMGCRTRYGRLQVLRRWLTQSNQEGCGVFVCIHAMDDSGKRASSNFLKVRTLVNDLDYGEPESSYPIEPSFRILSSMQGKHDYFLLDGEMEFDEWRRIQTVFADVYGGDKQVKDKARVMRLPGFYHRKTTEPYLVDFVEPHLDQVTTYTASELSGAFSSAKVTAVPSTKIANGPLLAPDQVSRALATINKSRSSTYSLQQIRGALTILEDTANDRAIWIDFGHALKRSFGDDGFEIWDEWSKTSVQYPGANESRWRWDGFDVSEPRDDEITVGTIIARARESGWSLVSQTGISWPELNDKDRPDARSTKNVTAYLAHHQVEPWRNEFDQQIYIDHADGTTQRLDDDVVRSIWMPMYEEGCRISDKFFLECVRYEADQHRRHPILDYLEGLKWDRVKRIGVWLNHYLAAEDNQYTQQVGRKFLVAAVRRVLEPGCKFDHLLVLEGPQGAGKSRALRILGGEWFSDALVIGSSAREVIEQTGGAWIVELAELAGLSKRDVESVKAFVTHQEDTARLAYGRLNTTVSRQFVLAATTNSDRYLQDETGNRRFWPIKVGELGDLWLKKLTRDRDQLWAEAYHVATTKSIPLWLSREASEIALGETEQRRSKTGIEEALEQHFGTTDEPAYDGKDVWVLGDDVLQSLGFDRAKDANQSALNSIGTKMRALGWERNRKRFEDRRVYVYSRGDWEKAQKKTCLRYDPEGRRFGKRAKGK